MNYILTYFCKLVVMRVIPVKYSTVRLANYMSFCHEFGDMIKVGETLYLRSDGLLFTTRLRWGR